MQNIYLHFASPEKNPQKTAVIHRRLIRKAIESGSVTGFRICIILAPRFFFHDSLPNFCVNFTEFFSRYIYPRKKIMERVQFKLIEASKLEMTFSRVRKLPTKMLTFDHSRQTFPPNSSSFISLNSGEIRERKKLYENLPIIFTTLFLS